MTGEQRREDRAKGFDPCEPVARPVRWTELLPRTQIWGSVELARVRRGLARGRVRSIAAVAVSADALLEDPAGIADLQAAGCVELFLDMHSLGAPGEGRAAELAALVEGLHARGLRVSASFTVGFDHDDVGCFERLVAWVEAQRLVAVELRLWTPDPASPLCRQLARGDRLVHRQLRCWDGAHVVVTPAQMSAQTLYRGWVWAQQRLATPTSIWRRRPRSPRDWPRYLLAVARLGAHRSASRACRLPVRVGSPAPERSGVLTAGRPAGAGLL